MSKQGTLFDFEQNAYSQSVSAPASAPASRSTDPATSKIAARKFKATGKLKSHHMIVVRVLRANDGGMTFSEIFAAATIAEQSDLGDDKAVARRLPELEEMELVRRVRDDDLRSVSRACRVNGNKKSLWEAVEDRP